MHVLDPAGEFGDDAVLAWVSGTGLRPVMDALDDEPELRQDVPGRLRRAGCAAAYPRRSVGDAAAVPPGVLRRAPTGVDGAA